MVKLYCPAWVQSQIEDGNSNMPVVLSSLTVSSFTCPWIWVIREVLGIHQIFFMSKWATNIMVNTHAVTIFVPGYEKVLQPQPSCWGISRKQVTPPYAKWGPLVIRIFKMLSRIRGICVNYSKFVLNLGFLYKHKGWDKMETHLYVLDICKICLDFPTI